MKIITAVIAATALTLLAGPAGADVAGTMYTQLADASHPRNFTTDYTCQPDGRTISFTFTSESSGSGTGTLLPSPDGVNSFAFSGANGGYVYTYAGTYNESGTWLVASASENQNGVFPGVTGNFTGIPTCVTAEPVKDNHGQYVSGAAKAGVTGKALAAIAKDVTPVGPYPG